MKGEWQNVLPVGSANASVPALLDTRCRPAGEHLRLPQGLPVCDEAREKMPSLHPCANVESSVALTHTVAGSSAPGSVGVMEGGARAVCHLKSDRANKEDETLIAMASALGPDVQRRWALISKYLPKDFAGAGVEQDRKDKCEDCREPRAAGPGAELFRKQDQMGKDDDEDSDLVKAHQGMQVPAGAQDAADASSGLCCASGCGRIGGDVVRVEPAEAGCGDGGGLAAVPLCVLGVEHSLRSVGKEEGGTQAAGSAGEGEEAALECYARNGHVETMAMSSGRL